MLVEQFSRWMRIALVCSCLLPFVVMVCTVWMGNVLPEWQIFGVLALVAFLGYCLNDIVRKREGKIVAFIDNASERESAWLDALSPKLVNVSIFATAFLALLLELAIIRWQGSVFEFFAFYKNFGLLSCLSGLGIGFALLAPTRLPLICTIPLFSFQFLLLMLLRYGVDFVWIRSLISTPISEQSNMGFAATTLGAEYVAIYCFLTTVFLLNMLAFIPIGQLCGRLMSRGSRLTSYGLNLLGGLAGVLLITVLSSCSTGPAIWFGIAFMVCILYLAADRQILIISSLAAMAGVIVLSWPVMFGFETVYSPYQVLQRGSGEHGWSMLRAAGLYYQRAYDLSAGARTAYPDLAKKGAYYDLPYISKQKPETVAVLGAGMGNDVAAALRAGAGEVDAVEIDPDILAFGLEYHPEQPYQDKRVHRINNDARAYLRSNDKLYDMIVFGLLDSHTVISHASSLRIDSYIYTLDALRDVRNHLKPGGVVCLSFSIGKPEMAKKIYEMMQQTFGAPPVCIGGEYDSSFTFMQNREGNLEIDPEVLAATGFTNLKSVIANAKTSVDPSTDDWPFFYMPKRVWPFSYIPMILLVVGLTYAVSRSLENLRFQTSYIEYFLLGAGFMLVEAKAITELGLVFGNTWYVAAIVISAIFLMAFFANLFVQWQGYKHTVVAYVLLLLSLGGGLWVASQGGFPATLSGQLAATAVLTSPLLFSGVVFSGLIARSENISLAMSMNILGAMFGGMLEYNAMYFGYRALYIIAICVYGLAFLLLLRKSGTAPKIEVTT
jgi:SAM-dependent methyltransferase